MRLWEIGERDQWRCQLCGGRVDRSVEFPAPMSATLDHIVPVASGGRHEAENVHLAHMICNSRKGDGSAVSIGGQLSMV